MKTCTKCKEIKEFKDFSAKGSDFRSQCKLCDATQYKQYYQKHRKQQIIKSKIWQKNNSDKNKETRRAWCRRNTLKIKYYRLKQRYLLTQEEYEKMVKQQNSKCMVCGNIKKLHVDHCHTTSVVRGLLCGNCNTALGLLKENSTIIAALQHYIEKWKD